MKVLRVREYSMVEWKENVKKRKEEGRSDENGVFMGRRTATKRATKKGGSQRRYGRKNTSGRKKT